MQHKIVIRMIKLYGILGIRFGIHPYNWWFSILIRRRYFTLLYDFHDFIADSLEHFHASSCMNNMHYQY